MMSVTYTRKDAVLSTKEIDKHGDPLYRYQLIREWADGDRGLLCWIMLNPSTADALDDDPTIRRCVGFAHAWGFTGIVVVNLFAMRTPKPTALIKGWKLGWNITGPDNDAWIMEAADDSEMIVCAWGGHGGRWGRDVRVRKLLKDFELHTLGFTTGGQPMHPLYIPNGTKPGLWK